MSILSAVASDVPLQVLKWAILMRAFSKTPLTHHRAASVCFVQVLASMKLIKTEQIRSADPAPWLLAVGGAFMAAGAYFFIKRRGTELKRSEPSTPLVRRFGNDSRDEIEQASWESFPASDPPAW